MSRTPSYQDMTARVYASPLHKVLSPAAKEFTGDLQHLSELILALPGRCGLLSVTCESPVMEGQQRSEGEASMAPAMTSSFLLEIDDAWVPKLVGKGSDELLGEGEGNIHAYISLQASLFNELFPFRLILNQEGEAVQVSDCFSSADCSECG